MIIPKLTNWEYYYNKLPLYLQESTTFPEHFKIWFELLTNVDSYSDTMLGLVNIFDEHYLEKYNGICNEFLDLLGKLYGVARNLQVSYGGHTYTLNLTTSEFLILIKAQIIKNFWNGQRITMDEFYQKSNIPIATLTIGSAQCKYVLFLNDEFTTDSNLYRLFYGKLLTIESLGISNIYSEYNINLPIMIWDVNNWDETRWA